jgi:hypothetical protein
MDANEVSSSLSSAVTNVWDRLPETPVPTPQEYIALMQHLDAVVAVLILGAGLVFLLQGWRIFRVWVIVTAGMLGVAAGERVGQLFQDPYFQLGCPVVGGLILALLAWPLMKYALGLIGGLTGGLLGHSLLRYLAAAFDRPDLAQHAWLGAIGGAVLLGVSALFLFRMVVIVSSSLQGSVMVVSGLVAMLLKFPPIAKPMTESMERGPHLLPVLMVVPAIIGVLFQFFWTAPQKPAPQEE